MNPENTNTTIVLIVLGIIVFIFSMVYISTGIPSDITLNPCDPRNWFL